MDDHLQEILHFLFWKNNETIENITIQINSKEHSKMSNLALYHSAHIKHVMQYNPTSMLFILFLCTALVLKPSPWKINGNLMLSHIMHDVSFLWPLRIIKKAAINEVITKIEWNITFQKVQLKYFFCNTQVWSFSHLIFESFYLLMIQLTRGYHLNLGENCFNIVLL